MGKGHLTVRAEQRARGVSSRVDVPAEADVVVIGGGSIGGSAALHLAERGLSTILLEKHQLTAGTCREKVLL